MENDINICKFQVKSEITFNICRRNVTKIYESLDIAHSHYCIV